MIRAYHYTWGENFLALIDDGAIKRSGDKDEAHLPKVARTPPSQRAAWFTLSEEYERTAVPFFFDGSGRPRALTIPELIERGGIYRIVVDAALVPDDWRAWVRRARVPLRMARSLEDSAADHRSPIGLWRVSYVPVTSDKWIAVEQYDAETKQWVPIDWRTWRAQSLAAEHMKGAPVRNLLARIFAGGSS